MKNLIKNLIRAYLKSRPIATIYLGKNKGFKFHYSDNHNLDMMLGLHEPDTFEVFNLFIKPGMVVADIGANFGYFTRFLSKLVGSTGKVFAFEPIEKTCQLLNDTIKINSLKNVYPIPAAVNEMNGVIKMYLSHTHYMASLDINWAGEKGGEVEVTSITLDSFFEEKGYYPDFIKMDIEGGGVGAVKGMVNCITKNEPVLFMESHTCNEDISIGKTLSLIPYDVYRVGTNEEIKYLNRDHNDINGIYGTVIAIPKSKRNRYPNWDPSVFQKGGKR